MAGEEVLHKLSHLLEALSDNQRQFLQARSDTVSDREAADIVGVSPQSVVRWKKDKDFNTAYVLITEAVELIQAGRPTEDLEKRAEDEIFRSQMDALRQRLPDVVRETIHLALFADKEETRLKAIRTIYEITGFTPESAMPVGKQSQVFVQILQIMKPQVAYEVQRRGLPLTQDLQAVIEGKYEELPLGEITGEGEDFEF